MADFGVGTRNTKFAPLAVKQGNFDYNDRIEVDVAQKRYQDIWIRPIGGVVNQAGPFTFTIDPLPDKYIQLNRARLELQCRIVGEQGQNLDPCLDIVAPVNLLGTVMWESVEVFLNGQPFSGASSINCGYKAYLETLLSYDTDAAFSHLHSQMFHLDTPGEFATMKVSDKLLRSNYLTALRNGRAAGPVIPDDLQPNNLYPLDNDYPDSQVLLIDPSMADNLVGQLEQPPEGETRQARAYREERNKKKLRMNLYVQHYKAEAAATRQSLMLGHHHPSNKGFDARYMITCGSASFDMYCPITHDFFRLNNHVGPGNKIDIRLNMHKHKFLLNSGLPRSNYKILIEDMKLHLHTIELKEDIKYPLQERYRMNETQLHKQIVAANLPATTFRVHNGGIMPKSIIFAMAETRAVEGDYGRNPFLFHHFYLESIHLMINGEPHPAGGLTTQFNRENPIATRAYHWLFENTGCAEGERGNLVRFNAFRAGSFIIPFDLTPDRCNGLHNHEGEAGFIDVQLKFSVPLPEPIYVLYEMVFNKVVLNDKQSGDVIVLPVDA